jgi:hypothetical protein
MQLINAWNMEDIKLLNAQHGTSTYGYKYTKEEEQ